MFWGLAIEPGKRYMQTVGRSFHLSMACLERGANDGDVSLMLEYENQEYVLCNLHSQKMLQCQLDLNFQAGEKVAFYSVGKIRVHLTGYLIEEEDDLDIDEDEEEEDEEEENVSLDQTSGKKRKEGAGNAGGNKKPKLDISGGDEDDEDDDDDDDDDYEMGTTLDSTKDDDDDDDDDNDDDEEEEEEDDNDSDEQPQVNNVNKSQLAKTPVDKQKKKGPQAQTPKTPNQQNGQVQTPQTGKKNKNKQGQGETPKTPKTPESQSGTPQKKVLQGGVVVQEVRVGNGPVAKPGKQISVYYVGRLKQNNKQFDSSTAGPGFKFNLGRGEVIKGWDIGVAGMRVGGKRTITVPPQMAYGKKGQPPAIPPNSVLVFDVELKSIS